MNINDTNIDEGPKAPSHEDLKKLIPIEAAYFYSGMFVDFNVYAKRDRTYNLLFKDVYLDDDLLSKLDAAEDEGSRICVSRKSYRKVLISAAENAEKEGIEIDWESVYRAADAVLEDEDREEEKQEEEPEEKEFPSIRPEIEEEPEQPEPVQPEKPSRKLGFDQEHELSLSSSEDIVKYMFSRSSLNESVKGSSQIVQTNAQKIAKYAMMAKDIRELFNESSQHYKFDRKKVDTLAEDICRMVRTTSDGIVFEAMQTVRQNEDYLISHTLNVACLNALIGKHKSMGREEMNAICTVGLVHDIGEQQLPPEILFKPAKLTDEEFEIIKKHPVLSYRIALTSGISDNDTLMAIRHHHERFNGLGYPSGLSGGNIPYYARITAVSDTYDAMVTKKPYKDDYTPLDTLQEFSDIRNSDLDGRVVEVLMNCITQLFVGKRVHLSDDREGRIVSLNSSNYAYPMVFINGEYVRTSKFLKVTDVYLFDDAAK